MIFILENTSVKMHNAYIIHRKFIVIGSETNQKMDHEELYMYLQNAISHGISPYSVQITLHYF